MIQKNAMRLMVIRSLIETVLRLALCYKRSPNPLSTGRKWDELMADGWWRGDGNEWEKTIPDINPDHLRPIWSWETDENWWEATDRTARDEGIRSVTLATHRLRRLRSQLRLNGAKLGGNIREKVWYLRLMRREAERNAFEANCLLCSDMDTFGDWDNNGWEYTWDGRSFRWDHEPSGSFAFQNRIPHRLDFEAMDNWTDVYNL